VYDVPSVGDDILGLIDHLNAGPAHVIGTSFAPAAAVWAAVERRASIRSLVLTCPFARQARIKPVMQAGYWLMMHNPWRVQMWGMYYRTLYPTHKPADFDDYMAQLLKNLAQPGRFDAANRLGTSSRAPSQERLNSVRVPTLVIMGSKDPDFPDPAGEAQYIAQQTGGRVAMIEGAGHYPQTEMPEKTAPLVLDFLRQSSAVLADHWHTNGRREVANG
jgi:pimeloyl-ACP methyl ester carboxylesterase